MTRLPLWNDCVRCERSKTRLGVLATRWPRGVQIVVLADRARRGSQAAGALDPDILRVVEAIRDSIPLPTDAVVGEILVACGLGELLDDHAAACSPRFIANVEAEARPRVVMFLDDRAATLAKLAGMFDGTSFAPIGWGAPTPALVWNGAPTIRALAAHLGQPLQPVPGVARGNIAAMAPDLLGVLGEHRSRGRRDLGAQGWRRYKNWPLTITAVRAHLSQKVWLAPFHPRGPWPFVVIDIDRHNALQEVEFHATLRAARREFPDAFVVQSSASKGVHVYVRLPPEVEYEQAALIVRAFLTLKGLRFTGKNNNRVASELTEVPEQPVRLPFGLDSHVPGSPKSLEAQLRDFIAFAKKKPNSASSFIAAKKAVYAKLKLRGAWKHEHREKIREWLLLKEAGGGKAAPLPATDPWAPIIKTLPRKMFPKALRRIAVTGIPAYGTRTRWTMALAEHVELDAAETLMLHWLRSRDHVSEDVESDMAATEAQTSKIVRDAYKKVGVPVRAWEAAKKDIGTYFHALRSPHFGRHATARRLKDPSAFTVTDLYDTAFAILRKFYERGSSTRRINSREFGQYAGKNNAADIEKVLTSGKWLKFVGHAIEGKQSRTFALAQELWPRRPYEECLHVRP